jgi:hypothetical protein
MASIIAFAVERKASRFTFKKRVTIAGQSNLDCAWD